MLEIKPMSECTLKECVEAWNKGFEGYLFDMTTSPEAFEKRGELEDLSPELSVVAFEDGQPVGIVRNGVREQNGQKLSWNGGTGVAASARGKGVGKKLMLAAFELLKEAGIRRASLEAIRDNVQAIELYKKIGYELVDEVHLLRLNGKTEKVKPAAVEGVTLAAAAPGQVSQLPFYRGDFPWQTQWQSVRDGEAVIALDENRRAVGYAYFRKTVDGEGVHTATALYQCATAPDTSNREAVAQLLIEYVFEGFADSINRTAINIPANHNKETYKALKQIGFKVTTTQVFMVKEL